MFKETDKVLVIAAHPDDEVIGCGGTIGRFAESGGDIRVLFFTDGATSRDHPLVSPNERMREAQDAADVLGIKYILNFGYRDQELDRVTIKEMAKKVTYYMHSFQPQYIFTHAKGDMNQDHRQVFWATMVAVRRYPAKLVLGFQGEFMHQFQPNLYVDIINSMKRKQDAMAAYKSENDVNGFRCPDGVACDAQRMGFNAGVYVAEGFELIKGLVL